MHLVKTIVHGAPFLDKELRAIVADKTPFMLAKPRTINVLPSRRCNAFCPMCPIGEANQRKEKPDPTELSEGQVSELLDGVKALCGSGVVVSFADGEPTLWRPLFDMIAKGKNLGLAMSFTTNGYTMRSQVAERVAQINPFNVGVSLESLRPEANEILRPLQGQGTRKTIEAIDNLVAARERLRSTLSINVKTVLSGVNFEYAHEIVERYGRCAGVLWTPQPYRGKDPKLWIHDTKRLSAAVKKLLRLKDSGYSINASSENLNEFVEYFAAGMDTVNNSTRHSGHETLARGRCKVGFTSIFVTQDGMLRLCPFMAPVGQLGSGESVSAIWNGKRAAERRKAIAACRVDCELSCTRTSSLRHKVKLFLRRSN